MHTNDNSVQEIGRLAFPNYNGRTFQVETFKGPMRLNSGWDGGSKDYYAIVNLETNDVMSVPENGSLFTGSPFQASELPKNLVIVQHTIFCGKDLGLTIYANGDNLAKLLPPAIELTREERIVLIATRSYKSCYAGNSNYRFCEARRITGISLENWNIAKANCIAKGLLNKAGAITNDGRNAVGHTQLYSLNEQ